jgi:hypothetical protein
VNAKTIPPALGEKSFSCPHCGAIAHQSWRRLYAAEYENGGAPHRPDPEVMEAARNDPTLTESRRRHILDYFERLFARSVFLETHESGEYLRNEAVNIHLSQCFNCGCYAVWLADELIHPRLPTEIEPSPDMPEAVRADFLEAAAIVDVSPRAAAALLRLALQTLTTQLGLRGANLDLDIAELVRRGLDLRLKKALEAVRVIGERAAYPGCVDALDDRAAALKLFRVVNMLVEATITTPRDIAEICATPKVAKE